MAGWIFLPSDLASTGTASLPPCLARPGLAWRAGTTCVAVHDGLFRHPAGPALLHRNIYLLYAGMRLIDKYIIYHFIITIISS